MPRMCGWVAGGIREIFSGGHGCWRSRNLRCGVSLHDELVHRRDVGMAQHVCELSLAVPHILPIYE